jgi:micrococcal nuclease
VLFFLVVAAVGGGIVQRDGDSGGEPDAELSSLGRVIRIVDGDTVKVRLGKRTRTVRYIGVDTPETVKPGAPVECFGKPASAFNRRLVEGRRVRLRFGPERHDRYGRLLAYVYVRGRRRSVSAELVARGYGRVLVIPPNSEHEQSFLRLERRAKERGLGLWSACAG